MRSGTPQLPLQEDLPPPHRMHLLRRIVGQRRHRFHAQSVHIGQLAAADLNQRSQRLRADTLRQGPQRLAQQILRDLVSGGKRSLPESGAPPVLGSNRGREKARV